MASSKSPQCLSQVNAGSWCQESYETSSRGARTRAAQLRKLGYSVKVEAMGSQVTPLGVLKLTLVDIRPGSRPNTSDLPPVTVERVGLSSQQSR